MGMEHEDWERAEVEHQRHNLLLVPQEGEKVVVVVTVVAAEVACPYLLAGPDLMLQHSAELLW